MVVDIEKLDWNALLILNEASFGLMDLKFINNFFIRCFANNKTGKKEARLCKEKIKKTIKDFLMQEAKKQEDMRTTKILEIEIPIEMNIFEKEQIKELIDKIIIKKGG